MKGTYNSKWFTDEKEEIIYGINLGADFTAEHEFGIKGIFDVFGVTFEDHIYGVDKRKIRHIPEALSFGQLLVPGPDPKKGERRKKQKATYFILTQRRWGAQTQYTDSKHLPYGLSLYEIEPLLVRGMKILLASWQLEKMQRDLPTCTSIS